MNILHYKSISKGISIPVDLLDKIDKIRGDIPRSRFIVRLLEQIISKGGKI